jgi:hypothetical protein
MQFFFINFFCVSLGTWGCEPGLLNFLFIYLNKPGYWLVRHCLFLFFNYLFCLFLLLFFVMPGLSWLRFKGPSKEESG